MFETPTPRWDTLAGRVLDGFFEQVASQLPNYRSPLTVFGSAPKRTTFASYRALIAQARTQLEWLINELASSR